jgi:hypothetical protein
MAAIATGRAPDSTREFLTKTLAEYGNDITHLLRPVLSIELAIVDANDVDLAAGLEMRQKRWIDEATKHLQIQPYALLDVRGLTLIKLARSRGMNVSFNSVYLPATLI